MSAGERLSEILSRYREWATPDRALCLELTGDDSSDHAAADILVMFESNEELDAVEVFAPERRGYAPRDDFFESVVPVLRGDSKGTMGGDPVTAVKDCRKQVFVCGVCNKSGKWPVPNGTESGTRRCAKCGNRMSPKPA